jgi:hypothetical protein
MYVNPNVALEVVSKFKEEKPAKKAAGAFYRQEQEVNTMYNLKHLNKYKYYKYLA